MSQFCQETKEYFLKIQKSPCQECGECQGILQNRMQKLASSDVTDSYADLTVKMLNPDGRRTMHLHWELRTRLTWPGPVCLRHTREATSARVSSAPLRPRHPTYSQHAL